MILQIILLTIFVTIAGKKTVKPESAVCEELIECYAKSRAKADDCVSQVDKHECWNETLQLELKDLNDEVSSSLEIESPTATVIANAKKKAKCNSILRKNPYNKSASEKDQSKKNHRAVQKDKKGNAQQKTCFREARKLRTYCGQLSKCCTISKMYVCKTNKLIDEKINAKRMEIKDAEEQCRLEHGNKGKSKDAKNHRRNGGHHHSKGQRRKSKNSESHA
ncbi:unnamed protein product [Thelazia callipaeda]|uniref:Venom protein n=1 Tax=Thelazia callipaeda TaxID=103827 RepID=A0A0N5D973_THECL|nr:unnamed protein product [Thelazia callipaeda]